MAISSTALAIVQAQQNVVGRSLLGATQSVPKAEIGENSAVGVLEQIRDISLRSFRAVSGLKDTFIQMFDFQKNQARLEREQAAELAKEQGIGTGGVNVGGPVNIGENLNEEIKDELEKQGGILELLGLGGLFLALKNTFKKVLAPLMPFFDKFKKLLAPLTRMLPFLGRMGPIGLVISGFSLLIYYSDEIAKALAPLFDGLAKTLEILKPVLDPIIYVGDLIIKLGLSALGGALGVAVEGLNSVIGGLLASVLFVKDLLVGIVTGDMDLIANAWKKVKNTFRNLGNAFLNAIISMYNGIIDTIPMPDWAKKKLMIDEIKDTPEEVDIADKPEYKEEDAEQMEQDVKTGIEEKAKEVVKIQEEAAEKAEKEKPKTLQYEPEEEQEKQIEAVEVSLPKTKNMDLEYLQDMKDQYDAYTKKIEDGKKRYNEEVKALKAEYAKFKETGETEEGLRGEEAKKYFAEQIAYYKDIKEGMPNVEKLAFQSYEKLLAEKGYTIEEAEKLLSEKKKTDIGTLEDSKGVTVINNSPTNVNQQSMAGKTDVTVNKLNTSSGDSYFDRVAFNQA